VAVTLSALRRPRGALERGEDEVAGAARADRRELEARRGDA
jgi:hypothetical protein